MTATRVDVAVIGAGPAGIAAAAVAAEAGADTLLIDEAARPGGQIWRHRDRRTLPSVARRWLDRLDRSGARFAAATTVFDIEPLAEAAAGVDRTGAALHIARVAEGVVPTGQPAQEPSPRDAAGEADAADEVGEADAAGEADADHRVRARAVILATGARERFVPFPGWTLPGVVGVGGAQALLKAGARFDDDVVVIAGTGPLMMPVAASFAKAGARVRVVAEQAPAARMIAFGAGLWRSPALLLQAARYRAAFRRARWAWGTWIERAYGAGAVEGVVLTDGSRTFDLPCSLLCTGYGLVGATELPRLAGCETRDGRVSVDAFQRTTVSAVFCAGEPTGVAGYDVALLEGEIAALAAMRREPEAARVARRRIRLARAADRMDATFALRNELRSLAAPDTIVCRCEDVPRSEFDRNWTGRQAKLYTRAGMGPCQGRVCGPALELLFGWEPGSVRQPVLPVPSGDLGS